MTVAACPWQEMMGETYWTALILTVIVGLFHCFCYHRHKLAVNVFLAVGDLSLGCGRQIFESVLVSW
jgi:hypothetical protein